MKQTVHTANQTKQSKEAQAQPSTEANNKDTSVTLVIRHSFRTWAFGR